MKIFQKIGIGLILLGVVLLLVGLHFFTYRGNLSRVISDIGKFSFFLCLPTIVAGIILVVGFGRVLTGFGINFRACFITGKSA